MINENHENPAEHHCVVTLDDVTDDVMACTCPHHVHRSAFCKHMAVIKSATDDGSLDAFSSDKDKDERISGPYTGYNKYGNIDQIF